MKYTVLISLLFWVFDGIKAQSVREVDICIYGGTSAGVIAAYTAKNMGKSVILIEPRRNLGGMTSGGLGYTDIGNKYVVKGLALDFYRKLGTHYGKLEQWIFEPKVAESIFVDYINKAEIETWYEYRIVSSTVAERKINEIMLENTYNPQPATNRSVRAKVFIDCSYEGDLMARAGVSYMTGRESNATYGETLNGVQIHKGHQFNRKVDPYKIKGDPTSGLLWGIHHTVPQPTGSGDKKIQAYNFRITLTNNPRNRIPITRPENYDSKKYELLVRLKEVEPWKGLQDVFIWSLMPGDKTDINNKGAFSTDMIGANWEYPEASYEKRDSIWQEHVDYTKGLLYFVGHDRRIPKEIRREMRKWGYPKDEFVGNGYWSHQLYVREARRMLGEVVMTQQHCVGKKTCDDGIGWAAYTMDSHNCDRHVINGFVKNEGNVEVGGFKPYPISYRCIVPRREEVRNLLVPVCLSASHIAYGSIRMEPVFMVLAQSSAVAASLAIDNKCDVQEVCVSDIKRLLDENPYSDGRPGDILVDDDQAPYVQMTGDWKTKQKPGYGLTFRTHESDGRNIAKVRYQLPIKKEGLYKVYIYSPKMKQADTYTVRIGNGRGTRHIIVTPNALKIEGQTTGEWYLLDECHFEPSEQGYVEISSENAIGTVPADAVLLVPQFE